MKLSFILCVYNTRSELVDKCLASVINAAVDDCEIIFIDDGSDVDYTQLVKKYRVKYFKTENQGLLAARLEGISRSSGEYIAFVDSDDTVSLNYYRPMLDEAERSCADIVLNGWAFDFDGVKIYPVRDMINAGQVSSVGDACLRQFFSQKGSQQSYFVQWNKLFRRSLLEKTVKSIKDTEAHKRGITYAEDVLMNYYNFKYASRVVCVCSGLYFYRQHKMQSVTLTGLESLRKQVECVSIVFDTIESDLAMNAPSLIPDLYAWKAHLSRYQLSRMKKTDRSGASELIKRAYRLSSVEDPLPDDGYYYEQTETVGSNFDEIDRVIRDIYTATDRIEVRYADEPTYVRRMLDFAVDASDGKVIYKDSGIRIPKSKLPATVRIKQTAIYKFLKRIYRAIKK